MKSRQLLIHFAVGLIFLTASIAYCNPTVTDDQEAGVLFLRIVNSARANGMGGCVLNLVDEQSAMYNPGALGMFHLDKIFGLTFPSSTDWLPDLSTDMKIKSFSVSGGFSTKLITAPDAKYGLALGIAYSKLEFDQGDLGYYNPKDKADFYTVALGAEYLVRIGVGFTSKKITSDIDPAAGIAQADARDFGFLFEIPIFDIVGNDFLFDQSVERPMALELTPSFAYVTANDGDDIAYINVARSDPLPKTEGIGFSLYTALKTGPARLGSVRFSYEAIRDLVGDPEDLIRKGLELGVIDALFLRIGSFKDYLGGFDQTTWGFGLDTRGIVSLIMASRPEPESKILAYLANHASLSFDFAKYNINGMPPDNTEYVQFKLSF
jgi:hypothetical protein